MSNSLKIVSFNVRCTWDWIDGFVSRMGLIYDKIRKEEPDVVAFQEVTADILEGLKHIMPDYLFLGHGRDPDYTGEGLYTAVNTRTLMIVGMESFWIAPNPYDKCSRFCDQSEFPRICIMTTLYHPELKKEFRVFNVHLDHKGESAMALGMECVLGKLKEHNSRQPMSAVVLGDFNARPDSDALDVCRQWTEPKLYDITAQLPGTFHDYGKIAEAGELNWKIDYIWVTEDLWQSLQETVLWEDKLNGHLLSDHYPVCALFTEEKK